LLGERRVNVVTLNLALDGTGAGSLAEGAAAGK
jgi:hypothetical protein